MGKAIPVTIAGKYFAKKSELKSYIQVVLSRYNLMDYLTNDDKEFFLELFKHHPNQNDKLESGIKVIQVCPDEYGHRYLHLFKNDGTDDDISWVFCVSSIK